MRAKSSAMMLAFGAAAVFACGSLAKAGGVNCDDPFAEHGAGATKACSNRCLGETMSCTATFFNLDGFQDSLQLLEAFDTVDGSIRVPAAGNLPIIAVLGNAVCTGATCNPATGANCSFPCLVCTAGTVDSHGGLQCPGLLQAGAVRVRQNTHVLTHTGTTPDTISFKYTDNCDSGCSNCPTTQLTTPAGSATLVPDCDDDDPCTIDCCELAVCSHPSDCVGATCRDVNGNVTNFPPITCTDNDVCTSDICVNDTDVQTDCCDNPPIPCPDRTCFDLTGCDPILGCQYASECLNPNRCNDSNVCTADACDENLPTCCSNTPIPCPDRTCFDLTGCDPELGCLYASECLDPNRCNDNDVCTADACDENLPTCCSNTPIPCQPRVCFNITDCDPVLGCQYESVCTDPNFCDDGDACTRDTCDTTETGCCIHENICICGDGDIDPGEFCDGAAEAPGVNCTDTCDAQCTCCGDGVRQTGERCDGTQFEPAGPNQTGEGTCRPNCTYCGDGTVNGDEECDDGNNVDTDECMNNCTPPRLEAICRTPGFWGTHAGTEKPRSVNITQAVIAAAGGSITVCGECINATVPVNNAASAVEALCVAPKGASVLQNARQLTAMALNCIVSGFGADCGGDASLDDLFDDCNAACLGLPSDRTNEECRAEIDCFNNGGIFHDGKSSFCQTGTCANGDPCNGSRACVDGSACTPLANNCHDRELCNEDVGICFEPPGPAGSSNACHAANANHCAILDLTCSNERGGGSGEDCCGSDSCP